MIFVPFLIHNQVGNFLEEDAPKGLITFGISIVALFLVGKAFQLMKSFFLRQPIRSGNY